MNGATCFFVSDLHGREERFRALFAHVAGERPAALFIGGDILPHAMAWRPGARRGFQTDPAGDVEVGASAADTDAAASAGDVEAAGSAGDTDAAASGPGIEVGGGGHDFISDFLLPGFRRLRDRLGSDYPRVFVILGNDDPRCHEEQFMAAAEEGVWEYLHGRKTRFAGCDVYGYSFAPPSPFALKDWERYDVSRYVDPGSISPEEGRYTVPVTEREKRLATIDADLKDLCAGEDLRQSILLFHAPPYQTGLDRADLDGKKIDHAPLDPHVGSIAIRRFIESRQPLLTLHGHIHESARLTGRWRERLGSTWMLSAAHDGPELSLVTFDPADPGSAERRLLADPPEGPSWQADAPRR